MCDTYGYWEEDMSYEEYLFNQAWQDELEQDYLESRRAYEEYMYMQETEWEEYEEE